MRSNRTLKEGGVHVLHDLVFTCIMLIGMAVLCAFKPRYIVLIVRGYFRAIRRKYGHYE